MQVTIIESFKYGVYLKAATTEINGQELVLSASMISGPRFAEKLSQLEDGMDRVTIVEMSSEAFKMKGVMKLVNPVVAPSNQIEEVVA